MARRAFDRSLTTKHKGPTEGHTSTNTFEMNCVQKLANILKTKRLIKRSFRLSSWKDEFLRLRKEHPENIISEVLDWYVAHVGNEFIPEAFSAKTFRTKFAQIKGVMNDDPTATKAGEEANLIAGRLLMYNWPRGIDQFLPAIVQRTLDNYRSFHEKVNKLRSELRQVAGPMYAQTKLMERLLAYLIDIGFLSTPAKFAEKWLMYIQEDIEKGYYQGNAMSMAWRPDSKRFHIMGRSKTYEYNHRSLSWDQLIERINL